MVRVRRVRIRGSGQARPYLRKVRGTRMMSPKVRRLAKKHGLRPDKGLRKGYYGTFRKGDVYLIWNKGDPQVKIRKWRKRR